jgi:ribosomal protein S18 acetylase RimI-like enzyme
VTTISFAQEALSHWHQAVAIATGGKLFTTHGCSWAWQPARARLVLLFPAHAQEAGLRPGLAEGSRLGARRVDAWVNSGAPSGPLEAAGFSDAAQISWHAGELVGPEEPWDGRVRLGTDIPEAVGPDAKELQVANLWRDPATAGLSAGHPALRRVEQATARTLEGDLVGRAFAQQAFGGQLAIHGLAVSPAHRRLGIGSALLNGLARGMVNPLGLDEESSIELIAAASPRSAPFFEANGMRLLGRGRHLVLR